MGRSGIGGGPSRGSGGGSGGRRGSIGHRSGTGRSGVNHNNFSAGRIPNFRAFRPPRPYVHLGGYGSPHIHIHAGGNGGNSPITIAIAIIVLALIFIIPVSPFLSSSISNNITPSTIKREPLQAGSAIETAYYEDTAGWISNPGQMEAGMKLFYQKTGVQPFIYITEEVDGSRDPSSAQMEEFSNTLYDELFDDEAHLLVVLQDADGHYFTWFITGAQAKQVIDNEAVSILSDYIDRYCYDASLSSEEFISKSFESAADRIMSKTANPLVIIAVVSGIVIVIAIFAVVTVKKINERKRQDEQMERILNSDLNDMAKDPTIQNLENKYSDRS